MTLPMLCILLCCVCHPASSIDIVLSAASSGSSDSMPYSPSMESLPESAPNLLCVVEEFPSKLRRKNCVRFTLHEKYHTSPGQLNALVDVPLVHGSCGTGRRVQVVGSKSLTNLTNHSRPMDEGKYWCIVPC